LPNAQPYFSKWPDFGNDFCEFAAQVVWLEQPRAANVGNDVMNNDSNGTFGIIIGGVVAVIAVIFILTGGQLGGKKTVQGDQDLPPVATSGD
jgi:hypothetical protein